MGTAQDPVLLDATPQLQPRRRKHQPVAAMPPAMSTASEQMPGLIRRFRLLAQNPVRVSRGQAATAATAATENMVEPVSESSITAALAPRAEPTHVDTGASEEAICLQLVFIVAAVLLAVVSFDALAAASLSHPSSVLTLPTAASLESLVVCAAAGLVLSLMALPQVAAGAVPVCPVTCLARCRRLRNRKQLL